MKIRYIKCIAFGFLISAILTIISLTILSIVMINTDINENKYFIFYMLLTLLSLSIGSAFAAKLKGNRGLMTGVAVGMLYCIFIIFLGKVTKENFNVGASEVFIMMLDIIISGFAGILGVNL